MSSRSLTLKQFARLSLCLLAVIATACHSAAPPPDIKVQYELAPQPPRVGSDIINLKLTNKNGEPISGARIELEGNMTHAGMSPVMSEAHEVEAGKYRGTLELSMAGDWIVLVNISLPDGQKLQRRLELSTVGSD